MLKVNQTLLVGPFGWDKVRGGPLARYQELSGVAALPVQAVPRIQLLAASQALDSDWNEGLQHDSDISFPRVHIPTLLLASSIPPKPLGPGYT
jgi:hypothetical protein